MLKIDLFNESFNIVKVNKQGKHITVKITVQHQVHNTVNGVKLVHFSTMLLGSKLSQMMV